MTEIEYLMMKYAHVMRRPVMFPEMAQAIGKLKYLACSHALKAMLDKGWMTETADPTKHLQFVYAPSEKGWAIYEDVKEEHSSAQFAEPIQGGF